MRRALLAEFRAQHAIELAGRDPPARGLVVSRFQGQVADRKHARLLMHSNAICPSPDYTTMEKATNRADRRITPATGGRELARGAPRHMPPVLAPAEDPVALLLGGEVAANV